MADVYLLDTNIVAAFFNDDTEVKNHVERNSIFLCSIVVGELFYGAFKSGRSTANVARLRDFESSNVCFDCDSQTAEIYGNLKSELSRKGRPIPENDIWIAAIAIQHDLVLATRDAHFKAVDSLKLEIW
jgi:tRNA(fMet)-specific endonuclease VapC